MNGAQKWTVRIFIPLLQSFKISPIGKKDTYYTFVIHKIGSPWDSHSYVKVVNCIKRDRRALKTSSHLYGTLKSFEMHGKVNQPLSFILIPIIRTRCLLLYGISCAVWPSEAWHWDDPSFTLFPEPTYLKKYPLLSISQMGSDILTGMSYAARDFRGVKATFLEEFTLFECVKRPVKLRKTQRDRPITALIFQQWLHIFRSSVTYSLVLSCTFLQYLTQFIRQKTRVKELRDGKCEDENLKIPNINLKLISRAW